MMISAESWHDPSRFPDPDGRARKIEGFMERRLMLWEGSYAGQAFTLHPWQRSVLRAIYGPSDSEGRRLKRTACLWLPRGSGKTTLGAGLALAHLIGPERVAGGQVILAAAEHKQAGIAFGHCKHFIDESEPMRKLVKVLDSVKEIRKPSDKSLLRAVSSEAYSKQGLAASFFLADELHAWLPGSARDLFDSIERSKSKRGPKEAPLTIVISTAGEGDGGIARELWDRSLKSLENPEADPNFVAIMFSAPEGSDWRDREVWRACNPGLVSGMLGLHEVEEDYQRAENSPAHLGLFKRYFLNQWQVGAAGGAAWLEPEVYDRSAHPRRELAELENEECFIGIDLGIKDDLTAVVMVFRQRIPDGEGYIFDVFPKAFAPSQWLDRRGDKDRSDYLKARQEGELELDGLDVMKYDIVIDYISRLAEIYKIKKIAIDPFRSEFLEDGLNELGVPVVLHGQNWGAMSRPVAVARNAIVSARFRHGGSRIMRQHFLNAVAKTDDAGNQRLTKQRSNGKIDLAIASIMALSVATATDDTLSPDEIIRAWTS